MGSERNKDQYYLSALVLMTIIVLVAITGVVTISKKSIEIINSVEQSDNSRRFDFASNQNLNTYEMRILNLLSRAHGEGDSTESNDQLDDIYLYSLEQHFNTSKMNLTHSQANEIEALIQGKSELVRYEMDKDINQMSLEGRNLILYMDREIYQLCGLRITFDTDNTIDKITEQSGNIVYEKQQSSQPIKVHLEILIIVLALILSLIVLCMVFAKKKQLFIKGGRFNGFDEKEYA
jgi:hypothetical protein